MRINIKSKNGYIIFKIISIAPIVLQKRYTGIAVSIVARIKNTKTTFSIDLGIRNIITRG